MKKYNIPIVVLVILGLHLSPLNILAQNCTQLSLPEKALSRLTHV